MAVSSSEDQMNSPAGQAKRLNRLRTARKSGRSESRRHPDGNKERAHHTGLEEIAGLAQKLASREKGANKSRSSSQRTAAASQPNTPAAAESAAVQGVQSMTGTTRAQNMTEGTHTQSAPSSTRAQKAPTEEAASQNAQRPTPRTRRPKTSLRKEQRNTAAEPSNRAQAAPANQQPAPANQRPSQAHQSPAPGAQHSVPANQIPLSAQDEGAANTLHEHTRADATNRYARENSTTYNARRGFRRRSRHTSLVSTAPTLTSEQLAETRRELYQPKQPSEAEMSQYRDASNYVNSSRAQRSTKQAHEFKDQDRYLSPNDGAVANAKHAAHGSSTLL